MVDATTRPPVGNMGPLAEPWRRWAEEQAITNAQAIDSLGGDASNDGRSNNAQMDLFSRQINELYQRQASLTSDPGFSSNPLPPSSSQTITKTIQLPRPTDTSRNGWLSVTMNALQYNNTTDFSVVFISLYCDNRLFHRNSVSFPIGSNTPTTWRDAANVTAYTGFVAGPDSGGTVTMEIVFQTQAGGATRTLGISDILITSQYSQRLA